MVKRKGKRIKGLKGVSDKIGNCETNVKLDAQ